MSRKAWIQLVEKFADGRRLCNCREAYYDERGRCKYGCSSNLISAKHEIAERVLASGEGKCSTCNGKGCADCINEDGGADR